MPFVDAHTHRPQEVGILAVINLHRDAVEVPSEGYFSAGLHPWFLREETLEEELLQLRGFLEKPNMVALGECGLDRLAKTPWGLQLEAFHRQLELADVFGKPVIIHNVRSGSELLQIRKSNSAGKPWLLHGFHGSQREAELFLQQGCYLGFGRMVLKPGSRAAEACRIAPVGRILPETDDSAMDIGEVVRTMAALKSMDEQEVMSRLYDNFITFFGTGKATL